MTFQREPKGGSGVAPSAPWPRVHAATDMTDPTLSSADLTPGRPVVFRGGTVLTLDDAHRVLAPGDVLVQGEQIAAVGRLDGFGIEGHEAPVLAKPCFAHDM